MDDVFVEKLKNLERRINALDKQNVYLSQKVQVLLDRSDVVLKRAERICHKGVYCRYQGILTNHN